MRSLIRGTARIAAFFMHHGFLGSTLSPGVSEGVRDPVQKAHC